MKLKLTSKLERLRTSKKGIGACVLAAGMTAITMAPQSAYAHGFVEKPSSRAALCSQNYGVLNLNCGNVMYEPQSLEAPKGFPDSNRLMGKSLRQEGCLEVFLTNKHQIVGSKHN